MKTPDPKVQMMDAGMAFYNSDNSYEYELERIEKILSENCRIRKEPEISMEGNGIFFLDYSSFTTEKYLRCKFENLSKGKFALIIYEGHRQRSWRLLILPIIVIPVLLSLRFPENILVCIGILAIYMILKTACFNDYKRTVKRIKTIIREIETN
ncbi:MAG: hypothetical protein LKI59_07350 [Bacteroidales bacterium]|jgi:hypothetical protein|nr:hypothetical protein [Bacteroidales bacterium]